MVHAKYLSVAGDSTNSATKPSAVSTLKATSSARIAGRSSRTGPGGSAVAGVVAGAGAGATGPPGRIGPVGADREAGHRPTGRVGLSSAFPAALPCPSPGPDAARMV